MSGLRGRSRQLKLGAAGVVALILVAGIATGFVSGEPSAEPAAQAFLLAWAQGQYQAAAALTTGDQARVTADLRAAYEQLGADAYYLSMGPITQHGRSARARFSASVDLGQDGKSWNYQGSFTLRKVSSHWRVVWSPTVINPGLREGIRMAVVSVMPSRAPLLDAEGASLIRPSAAWIAQVVPGRLAHPAATADAFAAATGLDSDQVLSVIRASPQNRPLTLVTLDPASYASLRAKLGEVPGLVMRRVFRRLFDSMASDITGAVGTEITPALQEQGIRYRPGTTVGVSGLQEVYQHKLAGQAETEIVAENNAGRQVSVLKEWDGQPGTPVRTTIRAGAQSAALRALGAKPVNAAIIAVQASTGHILAVADRSMPSQPRIDPLNGHYQPGGAFTIVSAAALLSGGLQSSTPIPCRASTSVGGRTFRNVPGTPALGDQVAFSTDFAQSCATAFTTLSQRLNAAKLAATARSFGLGAGWKLPLAAFPGSFTASASQAGVAANSIGQQGIEVSPLSMALVAAGVATGTWRPPVLITSPPDPGLAPRAVAATQTLTSLQQLMRGTVTSGAAKAANVGGIPVYGQVGSAPSAPGSAWWAHWFVGYRGGVAFAVLELSKSPSASAVPLGAAFLSGF